MLKSIQILLTSAVLLASIAAHADCKVVTIVIDGTIQTVTVCS